MKEGSEHMKDMKGSPEPVEEINNEQPMNDEQLMEAAAAKRIRRRRIYSVIAVCVIVLAVVIIAALPSQDRTADSVTVNEEVLSGEVSDAEISVTLSGAGTLTEEEGIAVTIPDIVKVECYYAENGDVVAAGDRIARVNADSVDVSIAELQQVMDELDGQLYEESLREADENITASVSGRVKMIYAQEGESVADAVYESGALMILSLDGRMSAEIECDADFKVDDSVTAELSDGTVLDGRVASVSAGSGTVTVTVSDETAQYGDVISVYTEDGDLLGTGELSAHNELKVVGYNGTVASVDVELNDTVSEGDTLMTLEDTGHTALYTALLSRRGELEDQMDSLYALKGEGYILAECDGVVSGIPDDAVIEKEQDTEETPGPEAENDTGIHYTSDGSGSESAKLVMLANEPDVIDDDAVMVNYVGQVVSVDDQEKIISVNYHKRSVNIDDYTDLNDLGSYSLNGSCDISYKDLTEFAEYDSETGEWNYIGIDELLPGDYVVITWRMIPGTEDAGENSADGFEESYSLEWIIRFKPDGEEKSEETGVTEDESAEKDAGKFSGNDTGQTGEYTQGGTGSMQDIFGQMQSSFRGSAGAGQSFSESWNDIYSSVSDETAAVMTYAYETYSIAEKEVAVVTPQDIMTVEITVDELDILSIETGLEAEITADALKGRTFTGTVSEIAASGTNSGGNTKYSVKIVLDRDEQMLDGMNASVRIVTDTKNCGATVPVAALTEQDGKTYIYTSYDERNDTLADPVEVETGAADENYVEIVSGLTADDTYYYRYAGSLTYNFLTMLR